MTSQQTRQGISDLNGDSSTVSWGQVIDAIVRKRGAVAPDRAVLVGISGIDGSGKGFVTAKLAEALRVRLLNVAPISGDDWLNLPDVCTNRDNYAEHFYQNAIRFDEMFERLILPLLQNREITITADCADAKATAFRKHCYQFRKIEIVLLEGIFLFKPRYQHHFDLRLWIDCSFERALARGIKRSQEGLPPAETIKAFETIYFPAQRIHLRRDDPRATADIIFSNER